MSTTAEAPVRAGAHVRDRFYVHASAVCLGAALVGFLPTYWVPLFSGRLVVQPIAHVHAILFYAWMLLFVQQSWLAANGRLTHHREWGVAGVALASAMCVVGMVTAIGSVKHFDALGMGDAARRFSFVSMSAIPLFGGLVAAALLNTRRLAVHKRLMLVATATLLQPALARLFAMMLAPPGAPTPPLAWFSIAPGVLGDLVIVWGMIHDKRTLGRVHPTYWIAGGIVLAVQLVRIPVSSTATWMEISRWICQFV